MKKVKSSDAQIIKNSDTSKLLEYSIGLKDKDIDFCINTISGRYPEEGYCTNDKCKEICYILEGNGTRNKKDESINFEQGDVILIDKKEIYYWNGNCKIIMICTPAWYKEQCKLLELMAKNLGYKKKITWDTIQNPYYPVGLSQQRELGLV